MYNGYKIYMVNVLILLIFHENDMNFMMPPVAQILKVNCFVQSHLNLIQNNEQKLFYLIYDYLRLRVILLCLPNRG